MHLHYQVKLKTALRAKHKELAKVRSEDKYRANVEAVEGSAVLVGNHRPICTAAGRRVGLRAGEPDVFQRVLGPR